MYPARGSYYQKKKGTTFRRPVEKKSSLFQSKKYTVCKLGNKIKQLENNCAIYLDPAIRSTNIQEKESIRILKSILKNTDRNVIQTLRPIGIATIVHCALVLVQAYVAHLKVSFTFWDRFKRRPFQPAVKYFHLLIFKLTPELSDIVIDKIMSFFRLERLWNVEFVCCEIMMSLLACHTPPAKILTKMLDYLEDELNANNIPNARHVLRVLNEILCEPFWNEQTAVECKRLIRIYHLSVTETDEKNPFYQMRRGFQSCLVRMCKMLQPPELMNVINTMVPFCFGSDLLPEALYDFSHSLELAILYLDVKTITEAVKPHILHCILKAISSEDPQKSRLACRLLARLFDRSSNFSQFVTPRLFLPNKYYKINVSVMHNEDKEFFKLHRIEIEDHLLAAFRKHQLLRNFEIIFIILAAMVVESPCGYTAAQVISIVLELQGFALLESPKVISVETNQMHAIVLSIMTLVGWVHRATSFSIYVQRILNRRSDDAPHLSPPLKSIYQYAQHHIVWNKPELFFDFWEIRYGIWKRFQSNEQQLPLMKDPARHIVKQKAMASRHNQYQEERHVSTILTGSSEEFLLT